MVSFVSAVILASTAYAVAVPQQTSSASSEIQTVNGQQYFTTNLGCYADNYPDSRVLPGPKYSEPTYNTLFNCAEFCAFNGFAFSGAEFFQECFCGNDLPPVKLPESDCDTPCSANQSENCGGANALTIQQITYVRGCFADDVNYRSLDGASFTAADMTIEKCAGLCSGFSLYGLEFGTECYCGNGLRLGPTDSASCNKPCGGDASEICGGSNALSVFSSKVVESPQQFTAAGCFQDFFPDRRVLDGANTASDSMTAEVCASFCAERAFTLFGTEFGRECFCGNTLPTVSSSQCTQTCAGDASEICGGNNAISVYYYNENGRPVGLPVSSSSAAVTSVATSSAAIVEPSTTAAIVESTTTAAVVEPTTTAAAVAPTTTSAVVEPVTTSAAVVVPATTSAAVVEPSTTAAVAEPSTTAAVVEPSTTAAVVEPSTTAAVAEPSTSAAMVAETTTAAVTTTEAAPATTTEAVLSATTLSTSSVSNATV